MQTYLCSFSAQKKFNKNKLSNKWPILLIIVYSVYHAIFNAFLPLHPDEAYYWLWSKHLGLSYFDHPPMVAYLIRLFSFFKANEFTVRLAAVFCMAISIFYLYLLAKEIFGPEVAFMTVIISMVLPVTNMAYTIITPDAPLMMFCSLSLYYSYKAIFEGKTSYYLLSGLFIGCLMLSKYTSVLFLASLLIFLAIKKRAVLRDVRAWTAIVIAFLIFTPVIVWNYQHQWISFIFQYAHGTSAGFHIRWAHFWEFLGGQFLIFGPIFFPLLIWSFYKLKFYLKNDSEFYVFSFFFFPLIFFIYKSLYKKIELNWGAISVGAGILLISYLLIHFRLKKTCVAGLILSIFMTLLIQFPQLLCLPPQANILNRLYGPREAVMEVQKYITKGDNLFADHLTRASLLSFYTKGHPRAYVPTKSRFSQFNLWDEDIDFKSMKGIYLSKRPKDKELRKIFKKAKLIKKLTLKNKGFKIKSYYLYRIN